MVAFIKTIYRNVFFLAISLKYIFYPQQIEIAYSEIEEWPRPLRAYELFLFFHNLIPYLSFNGDEDSNKGRGDLLVIFHLGEESEQCVILARIKQTDDFYNLDPACLANSIIKYLLKVRKTKGEVLNLDLDELTPVIRIIPEFG